MASTMSPDEIRNLLEELAVRLDAAGIAVYRRAMRTRKYGSFDTVAL